VGAVAFAGVAYHWLILAVSKPVAASEWGMVVYKNGVDWAVTIPAFSTESCTKLRTTDFGVSVSY
jgi:hypothetical protein